MSNESMNFEWSAMILLSFISVIASSFDVAASIILLTLFMALKSLSKDVVKENSFSRGHLVLMKTRYNLV